MSRYLLRWAVPALVALVPLGLFGLPALAQRAGEQPTMDLSRAKEMVALIEQGQLNLRDATALAEKHATGTALGVTCRIEGAEPRPAPPPQPAEPQPPRGPAVQKEQPAGPRLIYEVSCFVKDKLQTVRVDGLTKQVMDAPGHK